MYSLCYNFFCGTPINKTFCDKRITNFKPKLYKTELKTDLGEFIKCLDISFCIVLIVHIFEDTDMEIHPSSLAALVEIF